MGRSSDTTILHISIIIYNMFVNYYVRNKTCIKKRETLLETQTDPSIRVSFTFSHHHLGLYCNNKLRLRAINEININTLLRKKIRKVPSKMTWTFNKETVSFGNLNTRTCQQQYFSKQIYISRQWDLKSMHEGAFVNVKSIYTIQQA